MESDVGPVREQLAQSLFDHIPVGVGSKGVIPTSAADLEEVKNMRKNKGIKNIQKKKIDKRCRHFTSESLSDIFCIVFHCIVLYSSSPLKSIPSSLLIY